MLLEADLLQRQTGSRGRQQMVGISPGTPTATMTRGKTMEKAVYLWKLPLSPVNFLLCFSLASSCSSGCAINTY